MEEKKNNQMQADDCDAAIKTAQFRFSLIAPLVQGLVPDGSDTAYFMRITKEPLTLPDGRCVKYSWKTPQKWHYLYKKGGFDALLPKTRSDKGIPRALPDTAIEEILRLKEKYPRLNATQIHIRLVQDAFIPASVSVDAVQRFIRNNGLKSSRELTRKDRKAFEEDAFGRLWQADTCHFCYINDAADRKAHKVYLVVIIDDHSRMIVGAGLSYSDNSYGFQKVLKQAVSTYGIPDRLYTDNGSPYIDKQLALICGSIGSVLLHAPVRDGAAKAKVERNFRSMRERFLYGLDLEKIHSLHEFEALLMDYVRSYNTAYHSGIGCTPFERYQSTKEHVRLPRSREWLEECFLNRVTRKVRKDATVPIDCVSYDVPMQFISQKVEIRYLPGDMGSAFILYEGEHFPIRATDKNENCRTRRENNPPVDYTKIGGWELMFTDYYGLSFNPFDKQCQKEKDCFQSNDFKQMSSRLSYVRDVRGIGVFTAQPGMGKSFCLRCFAKSMNQNLGHMEYICLSTVGIREFYYLLCSVLGLEPAGSKPQMFKAVQEQVYYLYHEKKHPLCLAIDECQYLSPAILNDLKLIMNHGYDSLNCFSLILCGESYFNRTLSKPVNEALRQRVVVHYDFQGLSDEEVAKYVSHKIQMAGGSLSILSEAALSAVHGYAQGNARMIDNLMTDALIIGEQTGKQVIDPETILAAVNNQQL